VCENGLRAYPGLIYRFLSRGDDGNLMDQVLQKPPAERGGFDATVLSEFQNIFEATAYQKVVI